MHTCTRMYTHTQLHFQENTISLKNMSYFQSVLHTHVEHFLRQRHASGCVVLELREIMETKSSAHELQEKPWPQIRSISESRALVRLFYQSGKGVSVNPERNSVNQLVRKVSTRNGNDLKANMAVLCYYIN